MKWHALIIMSGVFAMTTALSEEQGPRTSPKTSEEVQQVFAALDRNEDKRISKEEAQRRAELRERFDGVDASGDGYLSRNEYRARPTDEPFE
jgi:Ca2+-binding EF-hand superfamily protein